MFKNSIKRLFKSGKEEKTAAPKDVQAGMAKTRGRLLGRLTSIFSSNKGDKKALRQELEELLYTADLGTQVTEQLLASIDDLRGDIDRDAVTSAWHQQICDILETATMDLESTKKPFIILLVGVNGVGKTTTAAKLAFWLKSLDKTVVLGAADTYRAAAAEQLEVWAERVGVDIVRGQDGADPSAVAYDAAKAAKSRQADFLIVDTAGRLHTNQNLMTTLEKMKRSVEKAAEAEVDEVLFVMDANTGQNALIQGRQFNEAIALSGIVVTKLDSSAKGGALVGLSSELQVPIKFVGTGESVNDLQAFDAADYASALLHSNPSPADADEQP
jgi:fused signal recognition particle receptor